MTLSYYLHIDTDEPTQVKDYDTLTIYILDDKGRLLFGSNGKPLVAPATYSNRDAALGFAKGFTAQTIDLTPLAGRNMQIVAVGTEDQSFQTSFVLDDFAVTVK